MKIRDAQPDDWPAIWAFAQPIVAAGETYPWPRDTTEEWVRSYWMDKAPPGSILVGRVRAQHYCVLGGR